MTELREADLKDWELKPRYGRLMTPYKRCTVLVEVDLIERTDSTETRRRPAILSFSAWPRDTTYLEDMTTGLAEHFRCRCTGRAHIFETDQEEPPRAKPYGYDFNFTSYDEDEDE